MPSRGIVRNSRTSQWYNSKHLKTTAHIQIQVWATSEFSGCCVDWNLQTLAIERTRDPKNWGQLSQIGLEKTDLELSRNHPLKRNSYRTSCKRYLKSLWNHQYPPTPPEKRRLRHPIDCLRIENCREFPPFFWTKISDFWKHLTCSLRYWLQADTDPHQVLRPQR